jgi:hypothetical protein
MESKVITITPQMASEMLMRNKLNRRINQVRLNHYAAMITNGDWQLNGESIKFDNSGNLIDGQHRLNAIIKSNIPINTVVIYGLSEKSFVTIDTGKSRTSGDIFFIEGIKNSVNISSGISKYITLCRGRKTFKSSMAHVRLSNIDILEEYNSSADHYQHLHTSAQKFYRANHKVISTSDYIAFHKYFQTKFSYEIVESFFANLENGVGVAGVLKNRLLDDLVSRKKISSMEKNALIIKSFKYYTEGKEIKTLRFYSKEEYPSI